MPPAAVNAIPQPQMSKIDTNPAPFSLRDFVVDDDAANFTASLWKSIDQTSFVLAQREALEAFNVAKAMRLSEETAAEENHRRLTAAVSSSASSSASASKSAGSSASAAYAAPTITVPIARPESRASDSAKQKSPAMSHHDRKPSSSASAQAFVSRPSPQPRLSLSTHVESSRVTNSVPSSSASHSLRIEQRSLSKREPESPVTKSSMSLASSSASSSTPHSSAPASTSTSHTQASDATNSKRRRTERQPSISPNTPSATQQPQQQVLVVPPIIDSQISTASVHLVNPPPTPVEARSRRRSTAKSPHSSKPVAEPRDVFMTTRSCTKCGTPVPSPRSQPLAEPAINLAPLLHVTCTKCHTMYCRGCFAVARCNRALVLASSVSRSTSSTRPPTLANPNECSGGSTCTVRNCCSTVRAIAIFEALSAFDDSFAAEAGFRSADRKGKSQSKEHRDAFVRQIIGGKPMEKDKAQGSGARRFEDAFVRALKAVSAWLQAPNNDDDAYPSKGKDADGHAPHETIPRLFETSLLLEVIHVFLGNTNVRDWVAHAETYLAILDLLRWMLDASTVVVQSQAAAPWAYAVTLKSLLRTPMRRIEATSGLRRAVWGDGNVRFEDVGAASDLAPPAHGREQMRSLCDLIKNLEAHRRPLMALASKATFEATVDKVNSLCDGILYLLLQQVVDEI